MLDDHVNEFKFANKRPVFLLKFLPFLSHKLLNVIVLFIGDFEFIVNFGKLFPSVLDLLF